MRGGSWEACAWCAGPTDPTEGVYLGTLYPDRRICRPCGSLTLDCTCPSPLAAAMQVSGRRDPWLGMPLRSGNRIDPWIVRRIIAGWDFKALAVAAGVSERTAYRWIAEYEGLEVVTVGPYRAEFATRRGKTPVQITTWSAT